MKNRFALMAACSLLFSISLAAKVVRVEIKERKVITDLPDIGRTGPYERIKGIAHLEMDPDDPANAAIVDLRLAARNKEGNVECTTEFELSKPVDPDRGNHRLIYFVCNRGTEGNYFGKFKGKDWLASEGWSVLYCGWQDDLPESDELYNFYTPVVKAMGKTVTGRVLFEFYNYEDNVVHSMPLMARDSKAYPIAGVETSRASLTMRQYPWEKAVELSRSDWQFAREEKGHVIPDANSLYITEGFKPGWLYDLVYEARDPRASPGGDSLGLFLASLRRYAGLPEDTLVLPSHGRPFRGLRARVDQLAAHHAERCDALLAACGEPVSAWELVPTLFPRELDTHQVMFAMGEAIAHLNHLEHGQRIRRVGEDDFIRYVRIH